MKGATFYSAQEARRAAEMHHQLAEIGVNVSLLASHEAADIVELHATRVSEKKEVPELIAWQQEYKTWVRKYQWANILKALKEKEVLHV